jgi:hypothetical protein
LSQGAAGSGGTKLLHDVDAFWNNHVIALTEYCDILDQLGGITFLFSLCGDAWVMFLCLCYLSGCLWVDGVFFVSIGKHQVHGVLDVASGSTMLLC